MLEKRKKQTEMIQSETEGTLLEYAIQLIGSLILMGHSGTSHNNAKEAPVAR